MLGVPEWSGGEEVSQYNAVYVIIEPGNMSAELPAVAHELTHVVVNQIIYNPYNDIPFWLNEGLAVHIQFFGVTLPSQFTTPLADCGYRQQPYHGQKPERSILGLPGQSQSFLCRERQHCRLSD